MIAVDHLQHLRNELLSGYFLRFFRVPQLSQKSLDLVLINPLQLISECIILKLELIIVFRVLVIYEKELIYEFSDPLFVVHFNIL